MKKKQNKNDELILLVDDDKFLLEMYSTKFRENGKKVEVSFGGEDALQRLRGGLRPDVIVLDIVMPNINGFELLETIKNEKLGEGMIIIMLTNQGNQSDIDHAKELGAHGYIVKASAIPSEVLNKVNSIINQSKK